MTTAAEYIAGWEGYASTAYWDVNHWRLGYGSDTEGPDQTNVVQGMTTTRARALQNLTLRIPQYGHTIVGQIGATAWNGLTENGRTALLSLAYNYGSLPGSIVRAIQTGNPQNVAAAISALQGANGGVNRKRRIGEAQFFLSTPAKTVSTVSKGAIVAGTVAGSVAVSTTSPTAAIVSAVLSAVLYLVAAVFIKPQPKAPPMPASTPSLLDVYKAKLDALHSAQTELDQAKKDLEAHVAEINATLNPGPTT